MRESLRALNPSDTFPNGEGELIYFYLDYPVRFTHSGGKTVIANEVKQCPQSGCFVIQIKAHPIFLNLDPTTYKVILAMRKGRNRKTSLREVFYHLRITT